VYYLDSELTWHAVSADTRVGAGFSSNAGALCV